MQHTAATVSASDLSGALSYPGERLTGGGGASTIAAAAMTSQWVS